MPGHFADPSYVNMKTDVPKNSVENTLCIALPQTDPIDCSGFFPLFAGNLMVFDDGEILCLRTVMYVHNVSMKVFYMCSCEVSTSCQNLNSKGIDFGTVS